MIFKNILEYKYSILIFVFLFASYVFSLFFFFFKKLDIFMVTFDLSCWFISYNSVNYCSACLRIYNIHL